MAVMVMVPVRNLYVQCSLQVRNFDKPGFAMSDACQGYATTAVEMADGNKMWRCEDHRGVRSLEVKGRVWENVQRLAPENYC